LIEIKHEEPRVLAIECCNARRNDHIMIEFRSGLVENGLLFNYWNILQELRVREED
jgi:hypothetical protein